jgi:hypothetical protein
MMPEISASPRFRLHPLSLREANTFVEAHHRHHRPVPGAKFSLAVCIEGDPEEPSRPRRETPEALRGPKCLWEAR